QRVVGRGPLPYRGTTLCVDAGSVDQGLTYHQRSVGPLTCVEPYVRVVGVTGQAGKALLFRDGSFRDGDGGDRAGQTRQHLAELALEAESAEEDQLSAPKLVDVARTGPEEVWVAAWSHQELDVHALTADLTGHVRDHADGGYHCQRCCGRGLLRRGGGPSQDEKQECGRESSRESGHRVPIGRSHSDSPTLRSRFRCVLFTRHSIPRLGWRPRQ